MSEVICIDLSGKELHRQVGMGRVVTSGSLDGGIVCTLTWNARDMCSIPALETILSIFITSRHTGAMTRILYKGHIVGSMLFQRGLLNGVMLTFVHCVSVPWFEHIYIDFNKI